MLSMVNPGGDGYSPVGRNDEGGIDVQLAADHPGVADPEYRARRNAIAALSVDHAPGEPVPYVEYTEVEHETWRTVCRELRPAWQRNACRSFLDGAEELALPADHLPQLDEVTDRLRRCTGFRYQPVAGLAPLRTFYGAFADDTFFSTQYIRHHSVPLYTPEPDICHEVLGHANQLADPRFAALYRTVAATVSGLETTSALGFLSKVFWFTVEFGVVWEDGDLRTYGAGLLSSFGELDAYRDAEIRDLDFAAMGVADYDITHYQPVLFAARSIDDAVGRVTDFLSTYDDDTPARLGAPVQPAPVATA
jgi:phenylalanine-4-hydroxylase